MKQLFLSAALALMPAHSFYSSQCCGGTDCHPVPCDQLVEARGGWLYLPTGNEFAEEQVHPSQDRNCHVCLGSDSRDF
jgi:hypothetical protein